MDSTGASADSLAEIPISIADPQTPPRRWVGPVVYGFLCVVAIAGVWRGWTLRYEVWEMSRTIHFEGDVGNGWLWGKNASLTGLFKLYDYVERGAYFNSNAPLDYTPLRLAAVSAWYRWTERHFPGARDWQDSYEFTWPMLWGNNFASLASAVLIFLLIRYWLRRSNDPPRRYHPEIAGLVGAMLFWFNPAVLHDGHAWPQWDIWCMPFYLAAVLLACLNWWFVAGILLAIGASLKGQLLMAAPILVLWPLVSGQWGAVFRLIAGAVVATALIAVPFMRPNNAGMLWLMLSLVGLTLVTPFVLRWDVRWNRYRRIGLVCAALLLIYPWVGAAGYLWMLAPLALIGLVLLSRYLPPRLLPHSYALAIAILVLLMMPLHHASDAWWTRGFVHGTEQNSRMAGNGVWNIPKLLVVHYRWPNDYRTPVHLPVSIPFVGDVITARKLMVTIYGACLLLCAIGAAMHSRRNDPRFLVAMVVPWVLSYLILTQMHGRYLVWGAGACALLAGVSVGATMLGVILSVLAWFGMLQNQYLVGNTFATNEWFRWINGYLRPLDPGVAWMVILAGAVLLYLAIVPGKRRTITSALP